ncbi:MAG: DUF2231 domain-containing protein [Elusimicrobia bacterium]|nr:DUF2231 domain-containing protein [Elusimicrobiota bacterium]
MDFSLLGFSGMAGMMNVHPAFVHFPIALLPTSLLFYALGLLLGVRSLLAAGRACLYLAASSSLLAVGTGWAAQDVPHNETIHRILLTHRTIGLSILALSLGLAAWSFAVVDQRPRGAWAFLAVLGFSNLLVMLNADLGARMVFLHGAAVRPAQELIAPKGAHGPSGDGDQPHKHGAPEPAKIQSHPEIREP